MNEDDMRVLRSCKYLNSIIYIIINFLFFLFIIMCYAIRLLASVQFCWSLCTVAALKGVPSNTNPNQRISTLTPIYYGT